MKTTAGSYQVVSEHTPLDAREQLLISNEKPTLDDFAKIVNPYINLQINVFKDVRNGTYKKENFIGAWKVKALSKNSLGVYVISEVSEVHESITAEDAWGTYNGN